MHTILTNHHILLIHTPIPTQSNHTDYIASPPHRQTQTQTQIHLNLEHKHLNQSPPQPHIHLLHSLTHQLPYDSTHT